MLYPTSLLAFVIALVSGLPLANATIAINEIMANNSTTLADEDGDFSDWVELVNRGQTPVDLEGYGLSDDMEEPFQWVFPSVTVNPGERLLVWASGKNRLPQPGERRAGITREFYRSIAGGSAEDLLSHPAFPDRPDSRDLVTDLFEAPRDIGDHFGQRMHGFLLAPATGNYTFWIAADNGARLYLGSDAEAAIDYADPIASVPEEAWTGWRSWSEYSSQQSDPVFLQEGRLYPIAAIVKEDVGGDHLSVAWRLPNGVTQEPMPASNVFSDPLGLHTNFSINKSGELIQLVAPDGTTVDSIDAGPLPADVSYGRSSDGAAQWTFFDQPTPAAPNEASTGYLGILDPPSFSHASGFYQEPFNLTVNPADPGAEIFYTLDGSEPASNNTDGTSYQFSNHYPNGDLFNRTYRTFPYTGPLAISEREIPLLGLATIETQSPASNRPSSTWAADGDDIVQSSLDENVRLLFGDTAWTDYELTLEARKTGGDEGFLVFFRADDGQYYQLNIGGWNNSDHAIAKGNGQGGHSVFAGLQQSGSIQSERWYDIRIRAEGRRFRCWLDDQLLFDHTDNSSSPNLHGQIGLGTWRTQARFRNIEVTSIEPAGVDTLLFSGMPTRVSMATVLRARAYKEGYLPSEVATQTYFVAPNIGDLFTLPVVSVAFAEPDLFGYDHGLYVAGSSYDRAGVGNFILRGPDWEKPAHVTFFEPNGEVGFSQPADVRIHGGWTRNLPQKSLRLYARDNPSGESVFQHRVFPDLPFDGFSRLLLRNSGNDNAQTVFRDAMMQRLVEHLRLDTQAYRPAIVYLNDEYWGIHNIRERFDRHYLARTHGVDPDRVDILEFLPESSYSAKEGTDTHFSDTLDYITANGVSEPAHYDYIQTRIDVENFIDYNVAQIFFNNTDWPNNNNDFWRAQTDAYDPSAPPARDGRWRWLLFDTDFGFGHSRGTFFDTLDAVTTVSGEWWRGAGSTFLLRELLENDSFRTDFINRYADLLNSAFQPERVTAVIDEMQAVIDPEMDAHIERWRSPNNRGSWLNHVNGMRNFGLERPAHARSHLRSKFGLAEHDLTVNVSGSGHIRINTIDVNGSTPGIESEPFPWTGRYFNVPIEVTAVPAPGYRFSHWLELSDSPESESAVLQLTLDQNSRLTAAFEETSQPALIHYWHFNDIPEGTIATVPADHSIVGNPFINYDGTGAGYMDDTSGSDLNVRLGEAPNTGLRVRNPSDTRALRFQLPTTGYQDIQFSYAVRRTNSGAEGQSLEYRANDSENWTPLGSAIPITEDYQTFSFDFSDVPEADDNPAFQVRILFGGINAAGSSGNNRFDNIAVDATPLDDTQPPPALSDPFADREISEDTALTVDLDTHFSSSSGEPLLYTAWTDKTGLVDLQISGAELTLTPIHRGEVTVTVTADDGVNPPIATTFLLLIYPQPYPLADAPFTFVSWESNRPENSFPEHMLFLQSASSDTELDADLSHAYFIPHGEYHLDDSVGFPYNNTQRTRINGLGDDGISFVNTGRGRDLGGALVAVDTSGMDAAYVSWVGETVQPQSRVYRLRLQYRTDTEQPFADILDNEGNPIEYVRDSVAGHSLKIGPIALPSDALGQPRVQLLWRYYYTGEQLDFESGARDELRLDEILITDDLQGHQATHLGFASSPATAQANHRSFPVVVTALTESGVVDADYQSQITLATPSAPGELSGTLTRAMQNGTAVFDDLVFSSPGNYPLRATGGRLDEIVSEAIQVTALTEEIMPRYMQGDQDLANENTDRVPFAYRVTINGLTPDATYRYGNRVVVSDDSLDQNGAGNMIFATGPDSPWIRNTDSPGFLDADSGVRHSTFTTDSDGSYSGWFVTEPTGNSRFTPGNTVTLRLLLNDGNGGEELSHYINTTSPIQIVAFGQTPQEGSAIIGKATSASRNFVVFYDEDAGESRPIGAVPVEITGSPTDDGYAAFYDQTVATQNRRWGAILPNALPNGLRRIEERSIQDGAILHVRQDADGFTGTTDPNHGIAVIDLGDGLISSYDQWRTETFPDPDALNDPAISGPDADPQGQGITNLMRYAFNIPFGENGADRLPQLAQEGETLHLTFSYRESGGDLAYVVEGSEDLVNWNESIFDTRTDPAQPAATGHLQVEVTSPPEASSRFFRVRVLQQTQ